MTIRVNDDAEFEATLCFITVTNLLCIKLTGVHEVLPIAEAFANAKTITCDEKDYSTHTRLYRVELDRVEDGACHVGLMRQ